MFTNKNISLIKKNICNFSKLLPLILCWMVLYVTWREIVTNINSIISFLLSSHVDPWKCVLSYNITCNKCKKIRLKIRILPTLYNIILRIYNNYINSIRFFDNAWRERQINCTNSRKLLQLYDHADKLCIFHCWYFQITFAINRMCSLIWWYRFLYVLSIHVPRTVSRRILLLPKANIIYRSLFSTAFKTFAQIHFLL